MSKIKYNKRLVILFGIVLRIVYFAINLAVGGHHCDEAMTSLNAASLANDLTDIMGEKLPVYFDTWLTGGQSPMATYLSAVSVKLFGLNLFAIRLPMLLFSIIGFCALVGFAEKLFGNSTQAKVIAVLGCISPWMLFSGVFVLDCNYFAHFLIIALYVLVKALKSRKNAHYILSMLCFSGSLHCYMSSVLLVPVLLTVLYIILIAKRKISAREVIVSVASIFVFSLPFILFGLVQVGVLGDFSVLGINFAKMPYYSRAGSVVFGSGLSDVLTTGVVNLVTAGIFLIGVDICAAGIGMNIFQFGNLLGGLFFAFGILSFVLSLFKNRKKYDFYQKALCVSFLCGIFFYCFSVNDVRLAFVFRLGVLTPLYIIFEGVGIYNLFSAIKKADFKKLFSVYLILSFIVFNVEFFGIYVNQTQNTPDVIYGDSFYSCLEAADKNNKSRIVIYEDDPMLQSRISIYCRYFYFGKDVDFVNLRDELIERDLNGVDFARLTNNSEIEIRSESDINNNMADFFIASTNLVNSISIGEEYVTEDYGNWSVVYKA